MPVGGRPLPRFFLLSTIDGIHIFRYRKIASRAGADTPAQLQPKPRRYPMAQAHSVPSPIQAPITGATAKASTKPRPADRRYFIGGRTPGSSMRDDKPAFPWLRRNMCADVEREDLPFGVATKDPNRRWYEAITGRMPIGWHVVAVCYATAAIFLGWWPWNFFLLLLLFPIRNKRVRFYAFRTTRSNGPMRPRVSCTCGSSL